MVASKQQGHNIITQFFFLEENESSQNDMRHCAVDERDISIVQQTIANGPAHVYKRQV